MITQKTIGEEAPKNVLLQCLSAWGNWLMVPDSMVRGMNFFTYLFQSLSTSHWEYRRENKVVVVYFIASGVVENPSKIWDCVCSMTFS